MKRKIAFGLIIIILGYAAFTYFNITFNLKEKENSCLAVLKDKMKLGLSPDSIYREELDKLQYLVEYSLVARTQMLEVSSRLKKHADEPLSSRDLIVLKSGTEDYLNLREELYEVANIFECATDIEIETLNEYNVDPQLRLKATMISLGAALTLYDNYLYGTVFFEQDRRLRKIINDPDMGFSLIANKLMEMTLAANSIESRHRIRKVIKFYEEEKKILEIRDDDSDFAYLDMLINSSPAYNYVKEYRLKEITSKKFVAFERITSDAISEARDEGFDILSKLFGNTLGLYESRKGKLYGDTVALKNIQAELKPLDILLEKTPFRLTDKLIPGHFGHVAIWTGTKAELVSMDLWDEQYVKEHQDKIGSSGSSNSKDNFQIIEALRSGVQLSTLDHFMNVDDFVILRPIFKEGKELELTKEALIMAFRQLGKTYDFNFDINTTDKIVCSELAYLSFPSMDWPTQKTLGRYSISPDHVAKLAWNNVPLKLVMFYHDGQLVPEEIQVDKMIDLMQK
ncbi:MAG: hypothetical protein JXR07_15690 [Reichenbachiella sp.]